MSELEKRVELLEYKLNQLLKLLNENNIIDYENSDESESESKSDNDMCKNMWCNGDCFASCNDCGSSFCVKHIHMDQTVSKIVTYFNKEYKEFKYHLNLCNKCLKKYN